MLLLSYTQIMTFYGEGKKEHTHQEVGNVIRHTETGHKAIDLDAIERTRSQDETVTTYHYDNGTRDRYSIKP
jgi:hypothetical protein